jgi:alpha-galactosidase
MVAYDLFHRFGALGAAGDRHLAEFVSWYLTSEAELHRWGVVATPFSWRLERSRAERPKLSNMAKQGIEPSGEEGVDQIEALLGMRHLVTNVNLPNKGQISWLPQDTIVETYAHWGRETLQPLVAGEPPAGVKRLIGYAAEEQRLLLEASLTDNYELAFQVLLTNPLVRIPSEKTREMFSLMLQKSMGISLPC